MFKGLAPISKNSRYFSVGYSRFESGRSLVEMLGMLAIMGILSVMGIAMYRSAMNRHYANELINEAQKRAVVVAGQINMLGRAPDQLAEFTDNTFSGGTFSTTITTEGLYKQFGIQVSGVPKTVCENMLGAIGDSTTLRRLSPTGVTESNLTTCADTNTFLMIYNNALDGKGGDVEYVSDDCGCQTVCGVCTMINEQATCVGECSASSGTCTQDTDCSGSCVGCVKEENAETGTCQACQRVEYLESTGTQWIDTGITFDKTKKTQVLTTAMSLSDARSIILGSYRNNAFTAYNIEFKGGSTSPKGAVRFYVAVRSSAIDKNTNQLAINIKRNIETTYDNLKATLICDGVKLQATTADGSLTAHGPMLMFTDNRPDKTPIANPIRIYYLQIREDNTSVRNFVPVHAPFNEIGKQNCMFDRVSKELFCNAGSGDFLIPGQE